MDFLTAFLNSAQTFFTQHGPALITLVFGLGYLFFIVWARHVWIFRRNSAHLHAYTTMVESRLTTEQDRPEVENAVEKVIIPKITELLEAARKQAPKDEQFKLRACLALQGAGKQLAAWRLAHEADKMTTDLWPKDHVEAQAVIATDELKAVGSTSATTLSTRIGKILDSDDHTPLRSLVKEARAIIFNARDDYYEILSDWQNKALWLVTITTAIVILIAASQPGVHFLLLGATGGLLARLNKTMTAKSVGFDYGVSWSILFLAPLVGALTGWAGVLISQTLVQLNVLNPEIINNTTPISDNTQTFLAFIFGFSARLFEGVMAGAEKALNKQPESGAKGGEDKA